MCRHILTTTDLVSVNSSQTTLCETTDVVCSGKIIRTCDVGSERVERN